MTASAWLHRILLAAYPGEVTRPYLREKLLVGNWHLDSILADLTAAEPRLYEREAWDVDWSGARRRTTAYGLVDA